jgi:Bacterial Ig-like domain
MRGAGRRLSRAAALSLIAAALGVVDAAIAAPPIVTITSPTNGSDVSETPSFSGLAEETSGAVTLRIYAGHMAEGEVIQLLSTPSTSPGGAWSVGPAAPLKNGTYTAQAKQTNVAAETGTSSPVRFKVDTPPPKVTLNAPESPSTNTTPSFTGTASGTQPVTVQIYAGSTKSAAVSAATAAGTGGPWTSDNASPALSSGKYTAVATQEASLAGNPDGHSAPVTFTVTAPPAVTPSVVSPAGSPFGPPLASFRWFPPVPQTGESVSLVSTASDVTSAITGLAWALTGSGPFQPGGAVLTTAFFAPGGHVVRLLVTNAHGLSSVAAETINVVGHRVLLMQPYPVVRLAGSQTRSGVKLRLLEVQQLAPGARITVRCKGRHCPVRSATRVAAANKLRVAAVEFRAFERSLRFGVTLEILVSAPGEIGKYTRFSVRRGKLPQRVDMCLDTSGIKPIACPAS